MPVSMQKADAEFSLTLNSYAERAWLATRIQDEIAKAERGEVVDLKRSAAKLQSLGDALQKDSIEIRNDKLTRKIQVAHKPHKKDLDGLTARINALSKKTKGVPLWATPIFYRALIATGVAAGALILAYQYGSIGSSSGSKIPQPQPHSQPQQSNVQPQQQTQELEVEPPVGPERTLPKDLTSKGQEPSAEAAPIPTQSHDSMNRTTKLDVPREPLFPLPEDATKEEVSSLGAAIIKRLCFDSSKIDLKPIFQHVSEELKKNKTDILYQQVDLFSRCVNLIPSTLAKMNLPSLGKAYIANQIRNHCMGVSWSALRDPIYQVIQPKGQRFQEALGSFGNTTLASNGTIIPDESIISDLIITASQKNPQRTGDLNWIEWVDASTDQFGNSLTKGGEFAASWMGKSFSELGFNATGQVVNQTGRAFSRIAGQFINRYPFSSPSLASMGFAANLFWTLCTSRSSTLWDFTKRSFGLTALGYSMPHLIEYRYELWNGSYNLIVAGIALFFFGKKRQRMDRSVSA